MFVLNLYEKEWYSEKKDRDKKEYAKTGGWVGNAIEIEGNVENKKDSYNSDFCQNCTRRSKL
jgi:hypothetical protein